MIDRIQLPYDAFVNNLSWLMLVEKEERDGDADAEVEEMQTGEDFAEGQPA